jgi:hypothetical protein
MTQGWRSAFPGSNFTGKNWGCWSVPSIKAGGRDISRHGTTLLFAIKYQATRHSIRQELCTSALRATRACAIGGVYPIHFHGRPLQFSLHAQHPAFEFDSLTGTYISSPQLEEQRWPQLDFASRFCKDTRHTLSAVTPFWKTCLSSPSRILKTTSHSLRHVESVPSVLSSFHSS